MTKNSAQVMSDKKKSTSKAEVSKATDNKTETKEASPSKKSAAKKESFKWSTPADEFADDVASDNETENESLDEEDVDDSPLNEARANGEKFTGIYDPEEQRKLREEEESFRSEQGRRSKKSRLKQKFPCPKCDKVWNWPWELRRHLVMHFKEKERQDTASFKCEECGKGFQWKRDLAQHRRLHTGEKLLVCSVCGKKFTTRQALLHHVVVHTGEKPFQCAQCGNRFTQPANLRTHMKKKHGGSIVKNKCPHCQEIFASVVAMHQHILEDHQNIVAEEREAQELERLKKKEERALKEKQREENRKRREARRKERMDLNDFKIKGLKEWEINYEFHIGDGILRGVDWDRTPSNGELICDLCNRKFGWRYEFMFHNLCHQIDEQGNTKNRVCPECETVFKVPIGLKHHLLTHTGELPFLCLHCWRSFASHIDLKLHLKREHLPHLEVPTPSASARKKSTDRRPRVVPKAGSNTVPVVMTGDRGQHETQTIILGPDGSIVNHNEDMIVVIQSDDFDQSQGLIVVDPSQIQHAVTSQDGTTMIFNQAPTTTTADEGEMVLSNQTPSNSGATQYVNLQFSGDVDDDEEEEISNGKEDEQEAHVIINSEQQYASADGARYVVVSSADTNIDNQQAEDSQMETTENQVVAESAENQSTIDDKPGVIMQFQIIQTPDGEQVQQITH